MGTSGAYGGSNTQPWRDAHDAFEGMPPGPGLGGPGDGDDGDAGDGDGEDSAAGLAGAIADALGRDDAGVSAPAQASPYALGSLIARGPGGGGGGGGGGGVVRSGGLRGESGGTGRSGTGSGRSIGRGAARGGAAIGGAYALRAGDATALADLGLDLDHLRTLSRRAQCARILDAVLGEGGHPDEAALRAAAVEQMKAVLSEPTAPPAEGDALRGFIASYVFQLALVELRSGLERKDINVPEAARREGQLLRYLKKRVEQLKVPARGRLRIQEFAQHADRLVREMLNMLRGRR